MSLVDAHWLAGRVTDPRALSEERERRTLAGGVLSVVTLALGVGLFGADMSPVLKAGVMYLPIALSTGFLASGATGL